MIPFLDLKKINLAHAQELEQAMIDVLHNGWYIKGQQVSAFEKAFAAYCGTSHCVGVANGLDALILIFRAYIEMGLLKPGDEVLVQANTYIASILSITECGLVPVFVEPDQDTFNLSLDRVVEAISPKTKAILAVHLYGKLCPMKELAEITARHGLLLVEDCAQSHGAKDARGLKAGNLSNAAGFSFYPGKNLGALGDAGAVTTNDTVLAELVATIGNYGSQKKYLNRYKGVNSRLDELQAGILNVKLKYIDRENNKRREIAALYSERINNIKIKLPTWDRSLEDHVFHLYVVQVEDRADLITYLDSNGIQSLIHYPIPFHKQEAYAEYKDLSLPITEKIHQHILSIPISPVMDDTEVQTVIRVLNEY
ncbi:DegT/DnrJ/EryC1/StrS family aminotransferase [Algoriphagus terrigena]|uniref:DegT/DnrJ/EryC1/StrS family aminotransferase n=1 Tax=Algoriphagus terrigena TaxID=344884 RepID=UPI00040521FE|nr:DegT/DnrJ/EryC1/StrS family aminotransferase [Algoriphagus terrigena]